MYLLILLLFLLPANPPAQAGVCDWAYGKIFPARVQHAGQLAKVQGAIAALEHALDAARGSERTKIFAQLDKLWNERAELGEGYRTTRMQKRYVGEHNLADAIAMDEKHVHYFGPAEQRALEVKIDKDGLLRRADGRLLDTTEGRTYRPAIFVMDADGRIFVYDGPRTVENALVKHSSLLAGRPVASAGEIAIKDGKVVVVSDRSGHYLPREKIFRQFLTELEKKKAAIPRISGKSLFGIN